MANKVRDLNLSAFGTLHSSIGMVRTVDGARRTLAACRDPFPKTGTEHRNGQALRPGEAREDLVERLEHLVRLAQCSLQAPPGPSISMLA